MANPQKENGHTDINHEDLEHLYACPLSGGEFRVALCVIRHTWGWKKKKDKMSLTQIVTKTKLARKSVCEILNKLVTKRLLLLDQTGYINQYEFNKNWEEWLVTDRLLGSYQKVTGVVTKSKLSDERKLVTNSKPTKESNETITNETNDKSLEASPPEDKRNPDLQELLNYADELGFVIQGTKQLNRFNAYNLLKKFGLENSKKSVRMAVEARGKPYAPTINDFIQLYRKIGDLLTYYKKGQNEKRGYKI